jgi:hypothetical protein
VIIGIMIYPGQKPKRSTPNDGPTQIVGTMQLPPDTDVRIFPAEDSLAEVERGVYSLRTGGSFFDEPAAVELPDSDR